MAISSATSRKPDSCLSCESAPDHTPTFYNLKTIKLNNSMLSENAPLSNCEAASRHAGFGCVLMVVSDCSNSRKFSLHFSGTGIFSTRLRLVVVETGSRNRDDGLSSTPSPFSTSSSMLPKALLFNYSQVVQHCHHEMDLFRKEPKDKANPTTMHTQNMSKNGDEPVSLFCFNDQQMDGQT